MTTPTLTIGRYSLVARRCTVRFTARGFGFPVRGELTVRSGEVCIDEATTTLTAVLDAASFRTSSARRDRDVVSPRFLDVERFPDIVLTGRWDGSPTPLQARLTVKDVAAPVEIEVVGVDRTPGDATVRARARVDRRAFPVGPARGPVGRWLDVELEVVLQPA